MYPAVKPPLFYVRYNAVILFCQRRGKVPRQHHIDVVLLAVDVRHHVHESEFKAVIQKVLHQHPIAEADGVGCVRFDPTLDVWQEQVNVLPKGNGRQLVTGRPVVDVGQEGSYRFQTAVKVLDLRDKEGVKLVFLKGLMGQLL